MLGWLLKLFSRRNRESLPVVTLSRLEYVTPHRWRRADAAR